jgi:hypothetical protein
LAGDRGLDLASFGVDGLILRLGGVVGEIGDLGPVDGREHGLQGVVILLADWVELVIVALGTMDRDGLEGVEGVGDHVVAIEVACDFSIDFGFWDFGMPDEVPWAGGDEAEGGDAVDGVREECIPGDLFLHEARVGFVVVEGADDVVAVGPCGHARFVFIVAVSFTEVDDIKPVPRPAFAVAWGCEEGVDGAEVGFGGWVFNELVHLVGGWGQTGEVEVESAKERAGGGGFCGGQAAFLECVVDEGVDGVGGWGLGEGVFGEGWFE